MQLIPSMYPFHYGLSYLFAVVGLIPNVFGGTHISVQHAALAQWLMRALNMTTGPGYSMPANREEKGHMKCVDKSDSIMENSISI